MFKKLFLSAALACALLASGADAQENLLGELYGLGVHAYHAGEYRDAFDNLSAAIEGGSRDPRAYFFRGLALANLGRPEQAQADFQRGAQLEVAGGGEQYAIGRALERIQGAQRLNIERVRKIARVRYAQEQLARDRARYEESRVVVEPVMENQPDPAAADRLAEQFVDPDAAAEGNPFPEGGLGVGEVRPVPSVDPPAIDAADTPDDPDPFGEAPAAPDFSAPDAGEADPFGDAPSTPDFGAPDAGGADPFGDEPGTPPIDTPDAGSADPFGDEPAAPDVGVPDAGDDPFGEAAPAAGGGVVGEVIRGVGGALEGAGQPDERDPFDDTDEPKAAPPAGVGPGIGPATPPGAEGADPFGADDPEMEAPGPGTGDGDPFGFGGDVRPQPAPADDGDPFGAEPAPADAPPAAGDPFADDPDDAPPAEATPNDPFADDEPADDAPLGDGDPFGA